MKWNDSKDKFIDSGPILASREANDGVVPLTCCTTCIHWFSRFGKNNRIHTYVHTNTKCKLKKQKEHKSFLFQVR